MIRYFYPLIILLSISAHGQLELQNFSIGGEDHFAFSKSLKLSVDSSLYVIGVFEDSITIETTTIETQKDRAVFLAKFDYDANLSWLKTIAENDFTVDLPLTTSFDIDTTGNIVLAINYNDKLLFFGDSSESQKVELFKLDSDGELIWNFALPVEKVGRNGVAINHNNEILLTGQVENDIFLNKYDSDGNFLWSRTSGGVNLYDRGDNVKVDTSGNVFVSGLIVPGSVAYFEGQQLSFPISATSASFVAKYDDSGSLLWVQGMYVYGFGNYVISYAMEILKDGSVVLGGYFDTNTLNFTPQIAPLFAPAPSPNSSFLMSFSNDGDLIFSKPTFKNIWGNSGVSFLTSNSSDSFYSIEMYHGQVIFHGDTLLSNSGNDLLINKYDNLGEFIWSYPISGSSNEITYSLTSNQSDLFVLLGSSSNMIQFDQVSGSFPYIRDLILLKLGDKTVNETSKNRPLFKLYPNPNSGSFQLKTEQNLGGKELRIVNNLGQEVYRSLIESDGTTFIQTDLNPSVYFLHCDGLVSSLVIQ